MKTGVKVGGNYVKYYGKKLVKPELSRDQLNEDNAGDIYDGLKSLKGSALKVAQMLSMEKNLLPRAYVEKFSLSQFSVPPLSAPLVRKTIKKHLGKYPEALYDSFQLEAVNAASIGQVHRAEKGGKSLAVKIQYPGVAESISSDLALVKPLAMRMFNLKGKDSEKYFKEVEGKLFEETNYLMELRQSVEITQACRILPHMEFPAYYPEWSGERILCMDWMEGQHLSEFTRGDFDPVLANELGQALWDFYMFQMHGLRKVQADPHPGNFLVSKKGRLIAIDFGCVKAVPEEFYRPYFELAQREHIENDAFFTEKLYELEILTPGDSDAERRFFKDLFREMLSIFTAPFNEANFDFGDPVFWGRIAALSKQYAKNEQLRKMDAGRGSRHFLYINRTFFGLYNMLHDLRARVATQDFRRFIN